MKVLRRSPRRFGLLAVSPLFVLVFLFVGFGVLSGGVSNVPMILVFLLTVVYALSTTLGVPLETRLAWFSKGAGHSNLLLMVWIFLLAGAFASVARAMGAIDACVNITLCLLPPEWLLPGLFLAACIVSLSMGTSVGTIVALVPVAAGIAGETMSSLSLWVAAVVGGSFFGDNLSFISDTTIASTRSQGCELKDKFKVNIKLVGPAAVLTLLLYFLSDVQGVLSVNNLSMMDVVRVLPYLVVLLFALLGINVLFDLLIGCCVAVLIGFLSGELLLMDSIKSMVSGMNGMGELVIISMMAGGLFELIKYNGGIIYIIRLLTKRITTRKGAELAIAAMVSLTNVCTANNTIAILSVGRIANDLSEKFCIDKKMSASILDTFSCSIQGILPYGAQILIASGLASLNPLDIIQYLYYPILIGVTSLMAIFLRWSRS